MTHFFVILGAIDQPTTWRLNRSNSTAKYFPNPGNHLPRCDCPAPVMRDG